MIACMVVVELGGAVASADIVDPPGAAPGAPANTPPLPLPAPAATPEPGWIQLPLRATELRLSGYAKLDANYDLRAPQGFYMDVPNIPLRGTPESRLRGTTTLHVRESRLVLQTRTRTGSAEVGSFLEADFLTAEGSETQTNSTHLRMRRYYGTYGALLAGQTWSAFMDLDAIPDTVDHEGPSGQIFIRQPQLRWTVPLGARRELVLGVENPSSDFEARPVGSSATPRHRWPDGTGRLTIAGGWGHVSVSGLARELRSDDGAGHAGAALGYGLGVAGSVALGEDRLLYELNGGRGIGRYVLDLGGYGARWDAEGQVAPIPAWGGFAAYQHQWARAVRSTIVYSETRVYGEPIADPASVSSMVAPANRRTQSLHVNLFWDVADQVEVGVEYSRGRRETNDGGSGVAERLQLGIRFYLVPRR